ncbi:MAG: class I SAM-dependent methyltransferase [Kofleriaceae bacterium]|nr:class I SAM-dependent methyltransferase [Kofleriaceae bacterium]
MFDAYFGIFPWDRLPKNATGFDLGCGSGRWASLVAPRVGSLHCIDASMEALNVARRNLSALPTCSFHHASVDAIPLDDSSMDFGYSLGVLHHIPDPTSGLRDCVRKLKPGAPFLLYLYYAFDNRPGWFRAVWQASDLVRRTASQMPRGLRFLTSQVLAATVYWPLARGARWLERAGLDVSNMPLAAYRERSFYVMRNDALDRFGTQLEQRFTRAEISQMMQVAGLDDIRFSERVPFWCAVGIRAR